MDDTTTKQKDPTLRWDTAQAGGAGAGAGPPPAGNQKKQRYEANWASLDAREAPGWFHDAKFGIFLHWGVFSVPSFAGGTQEGRAGDPADYRSYIYGEWFWRYWQGTKAVNGKSHGPGPERVVRAYMADHYSPRFGYTDFAKDFTAEFYDPAEWAAIFKSSGAKYVVLTSKHHDGYTLWGSKRTWNWNAVDTGPHRDLIGDLAAALRNDTDLRLGLYYSLYEWFHPLYLDDKKNGFKTDEYVQDKMLPELKDLVMRYKPEIVWADGHWEAHSDYWKSKEFLAWLYSESPVADTVLTNDRWGKDCDCKQNLHGDYMNCADKFMPGALQRKKWENCMTLERESYGYRRNARLADYYTAEELIHILIKTVSFGGNLLLNIGPTADGRITPMFEERLRQMGRWLKVNGESIYGTSAWKHQVDSHSNTTYYTAKVTDGRRYVYALVTSWPASNKLELGAAETGGATKVTWLGFEGDVKWTKRAPSGIVIEMPVVGFRQVPCEWAWVFRIEGLAN